MTKAKVAIVVDSTAGIPQDLRKKHNIHVIPQILNWEGESLKDEIDITPDQFYTRLKTAKEMPTTSQPSAGEFFEFFSKVAETADSIVAVLISEHLSGTQASARAAAEMMGDYPIEIVDSRSTVMGLGFMALAAAEAVAAGADHKTAAEKTRAMVANMRVLFVVDTLEYLHRGGRIGGAARLVGSMLSMKPVLHLVDGKIDTLAKIRTKKKAINHMLDVLAEEMQGKQHLQAAVIDALSPDEGAMIFDAVKERLNPGTLLRSNLSPVIGTHVGPGTVGVSI
ncbi:MAG: DegV family protein, partial [Anaerolineae bacterium]